MGKTKKSHSPIPPGPSLEDKVDLVQLLSSTGVPPSEEEILALLSARFKADLPYTRLNASSLVIFNPNKPLEIMNDSSAKEYADQWYRDTSGENSTLQPHIYEFAAKIYLHMRRSAEDQSVIFSGITGSGKTATQGHLLSQLLLLSTHTKKEAKLANQIQNAQIILEAFGNAKTVQNINASRFGKYLELQFNEKGRIVGGKALTYCFDKARVTEIPSDERSYHVFYYLLAGATPEERSSLHLQDPQNYHYLAQSKCYKIPDVDDDIQMEDLRGALKNLGFKSKTVTQIWQVLSAILLLGNIEFFDNGKAHDEAAGIKNHQVLDLVAQYLGVPAFKLEETLTVRTKYIGKDLCTIFLNAKSAVEQRDALSRALYSILFTWIVEHINSKLVHSDEPPNFISLLDQPGSQNFVKNGFEEFCLNFATEEIENYVLKRIFDDQCGFNVELTNDGIELPNTSVMDNDGCVELLRGESKTKIGGLISTLNSVCEKIKSSPESTDDSKLLTSLQQNFSTHPSFVSNPPSSNSKSGAFGVNHFMDQVTYSIDNFIDKNNDSLSPDFVNLFHGTNNSFIRKLFSGPALAIENHPRSDRTVVMAQLPTKPMRAPSMKRPKKGGGRPAEGSGENEKEQEPTKKPAAHVSTVVSQLHGTLCQLIDTLNQTRLWNSFHIRPNDANDPDVFDGKRVMAQIRGLLIPTIMTRKRFEYTSLHTFEDFLIRYEPIIQSHNLGESQSPREKVDAFSSAIGWSEGEFAIGRQCISLSDGSWKALEDHLRYLEKEERARVKQTRDDDSVTSGVAPDVGRGVNTSSAGSSVDRLLPRGAVPYAASDTGYQDSQGYAESEDEYQQSRGGGGNYAEEDEGSMWGSEWGGGSGDGYQNAGDPGKGGAGDGEKGKKEIEEIKVSSSRKWWVRFVWLCTWWIPSFLLRWIGKMKRPDVRLAWREKFTLCLLIFLLSAFITFYIIFFGNLICPGTDKVYSSTEVAFHSGDSDFWVSVRGVVYDLSAFHQSDHSSIKAYPAGLSQMQPFGGTDATDSFPVPLNQPDSCGSLVTSSSITVLPNSTNAPPFIHNPSPTSYPNTPFADTRWYWDYFLPTMKAYKKADLVWEASDVAAQGISGRKWAIIQNKVYDLSDYFYTQSQLGNNNKAYSYLNSGIETLFNMRAGQDITSVVYGNQISPTDRANNMRCLNAVFYVGIIDFRKTFRCQVNNYILLAAACLMASVILVKFLAALQLGSRRKPEDHDKFVICQVPCYTEGEDSLKRTMDSLAALTYDDKRKLLFMIADGNIVGSGNDRPTPRIVLDILGVDPTVDPEPLSFKSVGEGSQQLNYGKVYSGLYEYEGHVVPYIVVVKVGRPSESKKPGNRGKRDSQIILMRFLNRVHLDLPMAPLELEIYHQMKNVIGVDPSYYEYILMVDADTEVMPDSLNRMISCMLHDGRIIGICGETTLVNEEGSWTTMIQVYEYYISHHLAKAFESLFGSVTCLPGCFCMYRVRTPVKNSPLIISDKVIGDYQENHVDTLHKKNLLSLGEDRYLTTLMMKHFPQYKMTFTPDALCKTAAPDRWSILLSQRRRWINSTIHNLMELMFLPEMCGFCCFSMRFVVFIDLFGTLILPSTTIYIIYLIWAVATKRQALPTIALIMLAAVYGLQAIIFIVKRQWQHVGWMIIYLLAFPLFSFFIPIYSFWHFDDFSWGNTRVVVGEKDKKQVLKMEDDDFDEERDIPKKRWSEYEQEVWEEATAESAGTKHSDKSRGSRYETGSQHGGSNYGGSQYGGSQYGASQYGASHYGGSQYGGSQYGGSQHGGDYYRDTNLSAADPRSRSRSPVPRYAPSESRNSRALSSMGDPIGQGDIRSSVAMSRNTPDLERLLPNRPMSSYTTDGPTDDEIIIEIRSILSNANLMNITKKQVRERLTAFFGVDMSSKKDLINNSIEMILQGKI